VRARRSARASSRPNWSRRCALTTRRAARFLDASARRNAFGRQLQSFEADLEIEGIGDEPLRAVFIRAPWIERYGPGVEVLASYGGHPVAVREGTVLASAFHPELTDDPRFHAIFMAMTTAARERAREEATR